jgi:hypothetical protein
MMDISKMDPGDASFTAPFKLVAERKDYIHAFVAYFDVSFTRCHKLMGFSTGSLSSSRHYVVPLFNFMAYKACMEACICREYDIQHEVILTLFNL